jgi:hypothetical protein
MNNSDPRSPRRGVTVVTSVPLTRRAILLATTAHSDET